VCVPDLNGALVVWIQNQKKKINPRQNQTIFHFQRELGKQIKTTPWSACGGQYYSNAEW